jgi:hypothetical protein
VATAISSKQKKVVRDHKLYVDWSAEHYIRGARLVTNARSLSSYPDRPLLEMPQFVNISVLNRNYKYFIVSRMYLNIKH